MSSLYERIGGTNVVEAAVDNFYDKVLADDRIKHFFKNTDMKDLRAHQKLFLIYIFGGAASYIGKSVRDVHKHLVDNMGLSDEHFDAVVQDLRDTLIELGIPDDLIAEATERVQSVKADVLNKSL